jgi:hypothetical protein
MSERKGHGNRGSLMDLAKPRLAQSPLAASMDEAERLILAHSVQTSAPETQPGKTQPDIPVVHQTPDASPSQIPSVLDVSHKASNTPIPVQVRASRSTDRSDGHEIVSRLRKTREPIAVVGFKLPAKLKDELAAVAQYNDTDMTRLVVEALQRLLPELPHPPGWKR